MHVLDASRPRVVALDAGPVTGLPHGLTAHIDPDSPQTGIACGDDRLLGLDLRSPCQASDVWLRGGDVVAVYEPADPRLLKATALWRRRPCDNAAVWELVASATTGRERSDASLAVISDVSASGVLWGIADGTRLRWQDAPAPSPACALLRQGEVDGGRSVLIAVHPGDARRMLVRHDGGRARVECWLFSAAAEKGVLFRGRVVAAVGESAGDTLWAERVLADFEASPPMLTT